MTKLLDDQDVRTRFVQLAKRVIAEGETLEMTAENLMHDLNFCGYPVSERLTAELIFAVTDYDANPGDPASIRVIAVTTAILNTQRRIR